ncbi:hypothetical protein PGT21_022076 [Puccinia graminis f. sp. tritici]|uniref:Uncharacterized protein n=2 Tax=Puccinia graminis f. sp. tritici TaxID=56615 RepID=E3KZK2_PUCGT|nr:uncharacterized protein PGTG_15383 [Puccinia graminis f. sp. tritici CRL 75-36-700-3]EFP89727.2 hypothetical protein PGTG_15383 [Puccinia graminis f. sp. tritici CRL 75-36-700-3]KAA1070992.1 hypothetical protein PGTUg99_007455 [Puccinia graminis f. sp. tritici]KAA1074825.1 hypothetical protein PGT21_022076 [Puccinia graminis f. sp. tritici]
MFIRKLPIPACLIFLIIVKFLGATPAPSDVSSLSSGFPLAIRSLRPVLKDPSSDKLLHKRGADTRQDDAYYTCQTVQLNIANTDSYFFALKMSALSDVMTSQQAAQANEKIDGLLSIDGSSLAGHKQLASKNFPKDAQIQSAMTNITRLNTPYVNALNKAKATAGMKSQIFHQGMGKAWDALRPLVKAQFSMIKLIPDCK